MSERQCPACTQRMTAGRMGPLNLDLCLPCGGVWFDCGELTRLAAAGGPIVRRLCEKIAPSKPRHDTRPLVSPCCPACRLPMANVEFASMPGVRLDACRLCEGFWAGHPALMQLAAALEGTTPPRQEPAAPPQPPATVARPAAAAPSAPVPPPWAPSPGAVPVPTATHYATVSTSSPAPRPAVAPARPPVPHAAPTAAPPRPATPAPAPAAGTAAAAAAAAKRGEKCLCCGEVNAVRAAVCWACGKPLRGPVVGSCPRCQATVRRLQSEGVTLDACEGCGGVCVAPNRLNSLILQSEELRARIVQQAGRFDAGQMKTVLPQVSCPHCKTAMFHCRLGLLTQEPVHSCPQCFGLMMDHAVLQDILLGQQR